MREIKFRVWDKESNQIHYPDFLQLDRNFDYNFRATGMKDSEGEINWDFFSQDIELMQFTGLLDKNGKEIYEGDIISFPDTESEYVDVGLGYGCGAKVAENKVNSFYPVEYECGGFGINVKWDSETLGSGWSSMYGLLDGVESIEVIGNRFDNPELLTK